jgi:hypothetical protein
MATTTRKRRRWYKLTADLALEKELAAAVLSDDPHWIPPSWLEDEWPDDNSGIGTPSLLTVQGEGAYCGSARA